MANENCLKHGFPVEQPVQRTRSTVWNTCTQIVDKSQILGIVLKLDYSSCEIITVTELFFANHFW